MTFTILYSPWLIGLPLASENTNCVYRFKLETSLASEGFNDSVSTKSGYIVSKMLYGNSHSFDLYAVLVNLT